MGACGGGSGVAVASVGTGNGGDVEVGVVAGGGAMIILIPVGKYVAPDGTLLSSSASAIVTSDETTPFGCLRKAWFEVRAGLKGADTKSLEMGNLVHAQVEHYLKTGQDALGKEARAGKEMIDKIREMFPLFQIEQWIDALEIDGVKIRGRIDFIGRHVGDDRIRGIIDWKTSSDIAKWGKTRNQLKKDPQMLIYRQAAENAGCASDLYMAHAYFGTVKRESELVDTSINREQLSAGMDDIKKKLAVLKAAVKEVDSYAVKGDKTKCGRCPYSQHCTDKQGVVSVMSSLTDRFKKKLTIDDKSTTPDAPATQSIATTGLAAPKVETQTAPVQDEIAELKAKLAAAEAKTAAAQAIGAAAAEKEINRVVAQSEGTKAQFQQALQNGGIITPPDQPKSDPKLAADPVPGFSPIPAPLKDTPPAAPEMHNTAAVPPAPAEPPKSRGRPPGAKNKPKEEATKIEMEAAVTQKTASGLVLITRVKVSLGATVKQNPNDPKCFEFARADIGMARDVVGGEEEVNAARRTLADQCAQMLHE